MSDEGWAGPGNEATAVQLGLKNYADNFWPKRCLQCY